MALPFQTMRRGAASTPNGCSRPELLALKLNTGINNTSLVLAFELPASKKVLFFAADAQRGNWISWTRRHVDRMASRPSRRVTFFLGLCCIRSGTMGVTTPRSTGKTTDDYANLSWMATGSAAAGEFTAMITAVNEWADQERPTVASSASIYQDGSEDKAQGRVFQTDEDQPKQPMTVPDGAWNAFLSRAVFDDLFFDYVVKDE